MSQKITLYSTQIQQFLAMVPTEENGLGFAVWTPNESEAMQLTVQEAADLAVGWPYLDTCSINASIVPT